MRRQPGDHTSLAGHDAHGIWRSQRFIDTYFTTYPGTYFTGDGCRRDKDGYYWITGRVDDVLNVSGIDWVPPRSSLPSYCTTR